MVIQADYRQISGFEYASFKRSPLKAYQTIFGTETDVWKKLQDFAAWATLIMNETKPIHEEYSRTGLYDRLSSVGFDPARLSDEDQRLFKEQKLKLDAVHKKHARDSWSEFSIEKAWQAIHFLLTGQIEGGTPPVAWAVLGGSELADEKDYTAGCPLRILSPEQVRQIAQALSGISASQLLSRATIAEMVSRDIYAVSKDERRSRQYIRTHYEALRQFYNDAAGKGNGILLSLT